MEPASQQERPCGNIVKILGDIVVSRRETARPGLALLTGTMAIAAQK